MPISGLHCWLETHFHMIVSSKLMFFPCFDFRVLAVILLFKV